MTRLLLVAAVVVWIAAAGVGVGAGATWDVYPGKDTPIQDAGEGDMIYVHAGTNALECGYGQAGYADCDGADVITSRGRGKVIEN